MPAVYLSPSPLLSDNHNNKNNGSTGGGGGDERDFRSTIPEQIGALLAGTRNFHDERFPLPCPSTIPVAYTKYLKNIWCITHMKQL